jgi:hypothetical protein
MRKVRALSAYGCLVALALTMAASGAGMGTTAPDESPLPCPRPVGAEGSLYDALSGILVQAGVDDGGGLYADLLMSGAQSPTAVTVTEDVHARLAGLAAGTEVTLFAYVVAPSAGSTTPYSCVEIV